MKLAQLILLLPFLAPACPCSPPQQSQNSSTQAPVDQFIGSWILNPDKSSRGVDRESLTIEIQGDKFRFIRRRAIR